MVSYISRRVRRKDGLEWWDRALGVPGPAPKHDQDDVENSWRQAYYVPGADELLGVADDHGEEVPRTPAALCLSGGGIRSGCVAMGAMQTLSREPEGDEDPRWDGAPLLDGFDYIISVSGGGYTSGARLMAIQEMDEGGVAKADEGRMLTLADRFNPGLSRVRLPTRAIQLHRRLADRVGQGAGRGVEELGVVGTDAGPALSGDAKPAPGLNAVSYVLSADYIGGPELGWLDTKETIAISSSRIKRDLTVQAAVAISGAAFASAMGRMNKGFQSLPAVSGARLGTWLPNPAFVKNAKDNAGQPLYPKALPSVRGAGYFYRELFGINRKQARLVQVTDGGHYENLGLVEALRRRCRLIYVIDGGGDTPPLLSGLSDAIRLARFELGVEIELDERGDYGAPNLAPGSAEQFATGHAFHSLNSRLTAGAVVRGVITYPVAAGLGENNTGLLIVAKAVLWEELPDWVLTYGAGGSGESFPNDKTSDQWFNEAQFAAYTEVGRRIAVKARTVCSYAEKPVPPKETPED